MKLRNGLMVLHYIQSPDHVLLFLSCSCEGYKSFDGPGIPREVSQGKYRDGVIGQVGLVLTGQPLLCINCKPDAMIPPVDKIYGKKLNILLLLNEIMHQTNL